MSKPPPSKRHCVDSNSLIFEIVMGSGYLPWCKLNEELRVVSKEWNVAITEALNNMSIFDDIVNHINKLNAVNKCSECEEPIIECGGKRCSEPDRDRQALMKKDPRCQDSFDSLSKCNKAKRLYRFHASCVSNLLSFYGQDLSIEESLCVRWHWTNDWFCGMSSLHRFNPKAHWLFMGLIELNIAKSDLKHSPHYYESAFAGRECNPFTGTSYGDSLHCSVIRLLQSVRPKAGERGFFMQDWGNWHPSQFQHLQDIVKGMLNKRDEQADSLLGEEFSNHVDIFYKPRVAMLPRLQDIFPLKWMPVFDEDYEPPSTPR